MKIARSCRVRVVLPFSDNSNDVIGLFERALALDPQSVEAQSRLVHRLVCRVMDQWTDSTAADLERVVVLIGQALAASPSSHLPHFAKAQLLRAQGRYADAIPEYETALALNRNWSEGLWPPRWCKLMCRSIEDVIAAQEQSIRLSPRDPNIGNRYWRMGLVFLLQSRIDAAMVWLQRACSAVPEHPYYRSTLASALALKGEVARVTTELAEARRLAGDDRTRV